MACPPLIYIYRNVYGVALVKLLRKTGVLRLICDPPNRQEPARAVLSFILRFV